MLHSSKFSILKWPDLNEIGRDLCFVRKNYTSPRRLVRLEGSAATSWSIRLQYKCSKIPHKSLRNREKNCSPRRRRGGTVGQRNPASRSTAAGCSAPPRPRNWRSQLASQAKWKPSTSMGSGSVFGRPWHVNECNVANSTPITHNARSNGGESSLTRTATRRRPPEEKKTTTAMSLNLGVLSGLCLASSRPAPGKTLLTTIRSGFL